MAPSELRTKLGAKPAGFGIGWRHPHYRELLVRQPALDFLEVHSENFFGEGGAAQAVLLQGRASYSVSLHGVGLSLGSAEGIDPWHLNQLARLVELIKPVRVSDHACFARATLNGQTAHAADLLPIPFTSDALAVLCRNVQTVQDRLKRRFMVENLSAYIPWPTEAPVRPPETLDANGSNAETDFLNTLARRAGCALLVDVNNIYVNALNANIAGAAADPVAHCKRWLDAISPAHVGELHLAGHVHVKAAGDSDAANSEIVIDDHGSPVCAAVWALYEHAVRRFPNAPTLLEWDTAVPALDVLLGEVQEAKKRNLHAR